MFLRTELRHAGPDVLIDVLPNTTRDAIFQRRVHEPFPEMLVLGARKSADALARDGKLRTARLREDLGDGLVGQDFRPRVRKDGLLRDVPDAVILGVREEMVGAGRVAVAAQVDIAIADDLAQIQVGQHGRATHLKKLVIVPGVFVRMHEDGDVREMVVEVDDEGQVGHDFVAFV